MFFMRVYDVQGKKSRIELSVNSLHRLFIATPFLVRPIKIQAVIIIILIIIIIIITSWKTKFIILSFKWIPQIVRTLGAKVWTVNNDRDKLKREKQM